VSDHAPRILLVEDDLPLARGMAENLRAENYAVDIVHDGQVGFGLAEFADHNTELAPNEPVWGADRTEFFLRDKEGNTVRSISRHLVDHLSVQQFNASMFRDNTLGDHFLVLRDCETKGRVEPFRSFLRQFFERGSHRSRLHRLMADVFSIQRPRLVNIVRPLDNRPAVGEYRELVAFRGEL